MIVNFLSSTPGMFGWIAVRVHANKVTPQLQMMSQSQYYDGQSLMSSSAVKNKWDIQQASLG